MGEKEHVSRPPEDRRGHGGPEGSGHSMAVQSSGVARARAGVGGGGPIMEGLASSIKEVEFYLKSIRG